MAYVLTKIKLIKKQQRQYLIKLDHWTIVEGNSKTLRYAAMKSESFAFFLWTLAV